MPDQRDELFPEPKSNMPASIRLVVSVLILASAIGGAIFFLLTREPPKQAERRERSVTVDMMAATPGTYQPDLNFFGEIVAATQFEVRPSVSGSVIELHDQLRAGGTIDKGEVLIKIDPFAYQGALTEAEANLAEARLAATEARERLAVEQITVQSANEQLELAKKDFERAQRLNQRGSLTDQQVETRQLTMIQRAQSLAQSRSNINILTAQIDQRQAAIARAEWRLAQAQKNLDDTVILAPFDAIVQTESVEAGRLVTANEIVASLFDRSQLEARFVMTDKLFGELSATQLEGREARIVWRIDPEPVVVSAEIVRSGALIDAGRGGVDVFAAIDASAADQLRPGTFVQIELKGPATERAFLVPEAALYDNEFVYVRQDGRINKRDVRFVGFSGTELVIVSDNIAPGDEIIVTRLAQAAEGLKVVNEQEAATERAKRQQRAAQNRAGDGEGAPDERARAPREGRAGGGRPQERAREGGPAEGARRDRGGRSEGPQDSPTSADDASAQGAGS